MSTTCLQAAAGYDRDRPGFGVTGQSVEEALGGPVSPSGGGSGAARTC
jgi:hypothetical protein